MKRILMASLSVILLLTSILLYVIFFVRGDGAEEPSESQGEALNTEQPEDIVIIPETVNDISYKEILPPEWPTYEAASKSTIPWDMIIFDGGLYVGNGDYDVNSGPVCVMRYSIENGVWENTGELPDEQISRFCIMGSTLVIPGADPQDPWDFGNYYVYQDGVWSVARSIPNAIHNFDMIEYKQKVFAGIGVVGGLYPLSCSLDGGVTFAQVEMYKNGEKLDTLGKSYIRVYDFAVVGEELYAFFRCSDGEAKIFELYKYNDETAVFEYVSDLTEKIEIKRISYDLLRSKVLMENKLYFSTGELYSTSDMDSFEKITLKDDHIVCDLYEYEGELYALSGCSCDGGGYTVSVWQLYGEEFVERFNFKYDAPPMSFACLENTFYIGFGNYVADNAANGTFVSVEIE